MRDKIWDSILWILKREKELGNNMLSPLKIKNILLEKSKIEGKMVRKEIQNLDDLKKKINECKKCNLYRSRHNVVIGEGPVNAKLMFIGEAPGYDEDMQGRPFVGRSGRKLRELLKKVGIKDSDFYIANILKCRPPNNRDPEDDEVKACYPFLQFQLDAIKPNIICTLGRYASYKMLGEVKKMGDLRGKIFPKDNYIIMPIYHPSFILRNNRMEPLYIEDLKKVKEELKKI